MYTNRVLGFWVFLQRENEIFNLEILENAVIFSEVKYKKSTYI
uniref:Uncharacterized protein n=1 Tax=Siphoviridae sp. ctNEy24 TaxID=2825466 RepID=A0A8S5U0I4_9CAUD|nr:MAG TPA: hypothetical protein [Siphoviridae sp. ctNEy24]